MMTLSQMSLSGAVMIAVIMIIRFLAVNRLPKRIFSVLWTIALLRLLMPFSFPSRFSVYTLAYFATGERMPFREMEVSTAVNTAGISPSISTAGPGEALSEPLVSPVSPWWLVWSVGMFLCAVFFVISYLRYRRVFQSSLTAENAFTANWLSSLRLRRRISIRQSERIDAPLTYGILRPVILMPDATNWTDTEALQYILAHELIHIRHFDAATKMGLALVVSVHWFNPMVWIMYFLFNRDMELACDESVIQRFGENSRLAYALTLISMEERKSGLVPLYSGFSKDAIEERIVAIMKHKKMTRRVLAVAVMLVVGFVTVFATSAWSGNSQSFDARNRMENTASELDAETAPITSSNGAAQYNQNGGRAFTSGGTGNIGLTSDSGKVRNANSPEPVSWLDYAPFGLRYDQTEDKLYFDGEPVRYFFDGVNLSDNDQSAYREFLNESGTVDVHTVRERIDNGDGSFNPFGKLTGIEKFSQEEFEKRDLSNFYGHADAVTEVTETSEPTKEPGARAETGEAITEAMGTFDPTAKSFFERFEAYKDFGITYIEAENASGAGNVYFNGQPVNIFSDVSPTGRVFSFHSADGGAINVITVYDNGKLAGVEKQTN